MRSEWRLFGLISAFLFVAALVYGLYATFSTPEPERPRLGLVPAASPAGGGILLRGTF